jgi:hypothetical protein
MKIALANPRQPSPTLANAPTTLFPVLLSSSAFVYSFLFYFSGLFRFLGLCFLFASPSTPFAPFLSYLSCVSLLNNHFYVFDCIDSYPTKMVDYFF